MAASITSLISFEKLWLRVVSAMTGNPPLGSESHFRPCPDLPKFNVTKVMDHNRSYAKCHLQPYKRFIQMTCNCGTPLIHISHAQNGYIKSGLLRQSFELFASDPGKVTQEFVSLLTVK